MDNLELDDLYHRRTTFYDSDEVFSLIPIAREHLLKSSTSARAGGSKPHASTFLGKAGSAGLEVLDTLGTGLTNLYPTRFVPNTTSRSIKVSIFAFEVANTIVKGSSLMQSLSEENIQILKNEILHSEGVQLLVSTDMKELLRIAAADKREEFEVFFREVVRFGDMCIDPQWHNMNLSFVSDRYFKYGFQRGTNQPFSNLKKSQKKWFSSSQTERSINRDLTMQQLANLAQHTSELSHEYETLARLEQDYQCELQMAESSHVSRKGKILTKLYSDLKNQRKLVTKLKKKSLWSKSLEEVLPKLVDAAIFIHQAFVEAFDENATSSTMNGKETDTEPKRLGVAGLALHYAKLITLMNTIASNPTSLSPNMRNMLYNALPANVTASLRSHLHALKYQVPMTMPQVKAEMDKTLHWLVPLATHTIKHRAQQGFGFVGEWINTGFEVGMKTAGSNNNIIRLQTLYHADKQKMDRYILDMIILLQRLWLLRCKENTPSPPTSKGRLNGKLKMSLEDKNVLERVTERRMLDLQVSESHEFVAGKLKMSLEDKNALERVTERIMLDLQISKSHEFVTVKKKGFTQARTYSF